MFEDFLCFLLLSQTSPLNGTGTETSTDNDGTHDFFGRRGGHRRHHDHSVLSRHWILINHCVNSINALSTSALKAMFTLQRVVAAYYKSNFIMDLDHDGTTEEKYVACSPFAVAHYQYNQCFSSTVACLIK
ncbi:uncharacterized protein PHALS_14809 [Plasmopara halstedii]|uniref:RxLR-like protein n=1 Tax=Plasmopara halstedii TaxID=4781 RepID=A0A0P1AT48_PLAHL|nr:uncharacterized protein PHALS_14809 [Plasmopara halstedii]CEG45409.1 hypothetical protein PHALS_14809 [Plasmopara halstedii]|eukprot:XP_024581778.1 hypothetical protein PHALS_14809 [Plasmopara halstedii]